MNRSKGLARFAFMHCIAASLCFWIYAIKNETLDSILNKKYYYEKSYCTYEDGSTNNPYDDHDDRSYGVGEVGSFLWSAVSEYDYGGGGGPSARLEEDGKAGQCFF